MALKKAVKKKSAPAPEKQPWPSCMKCDKPASMMRRNHQTQEPEHYCSPHFPQPKDRTDVPKPVKKSLKKKVKA